MHGKRLDFTSVSGVFAFGDRIDKASLLLIENFKPSGASFFVLDVGCGYGPIALCIKARYPHLQVTAVDINERALEYTRKNADINNLYVEVIKSNLYDELRGRLFGDIVSNPPIGKKVHKLIKEHNLYGWSLWLPHFIIKAARLLSNYGRDVRQC